MKYTLLNNSRLLLYIPDLVNQCNTYMQYLCMYVQLRTFFFIGKNLNFKRKAMPICSTKKVMAMEIMQTMAFIQILPILLGIALVISHSLKSAEDHGK